MPVLVSFAAGLLFGIGLLVSGMGNPAKVMNFLDITGTFDPSLAFVMGGALLVTFFGYRVVLGQKRPLFDTKFHVPTKTAIDARLTGGAALFGTGWGLGGFCPGPAITALPLAATGTLVFVAAMLIGIFASTVVTAKP